MLVLRDFKYTYKQKICLDVFDFSFKGPQIYSYWFVMKYAFQGVISQKLF